GAGRARRGAGEAPYVHVGVHGDPLHMDGEDVLPLLDVGHRDHDLPIEASGSQQCRIEDVGPVRRRQDDDAVLGIEAVHLHEHLVERLLALVVAAAVSGAASAAYGVELIYEYYAGGASPPLLEKVSDATGADPDEHLDEIRPRHMEEGHVCLAGDGFREQGLAGARHADEKGALRDARSHLHELLRVLEVVDYLEKLVFRLLLAGDVLEGRLLRRLDVALGPAF